MSDTNGSALASYNENLVLAGGVVSRQYTNQLWMLGEDDHWQQPIPPMPTPRAQASAVSYGHHLIVAGGQCSVGSILNTVEVYSGHQWMEADPMPRSYHVMKSTVLNGMWYLTGGLTGFGTLITNTDTVVHSVSLQALTERAASPQRDGPSPWNKLIDVPNKMMAIASATGGLVTFGGYGLVSYMATTYTRRLPDVHVYFAPTKSWKAIGKLPYYLYSTCAVTLPSGEVMLCGGRAYNHGDVDTVYIVKV